MLGTGNSRKAESSEQLQLSWGRGTRLDVWQEVFVWEGLWGRGLWYKDGLVLEVIELS